LAPFFNGAAGRGVRAISAKRFDVVSDVLLYDGAVPDASHATAA
jgi:hypothetical protein